MNCCFMQRGTQNAPKRTKTAELDGPLAALFLATSAVSVELLLPLVCKSWDSRESRKGDD